MLRDLSRSDHANREEAFILQSLPKRSLLSTLHLKMVKNEKGVLPLQIISRQRPVSGSIGPPRLRKSIRVSQNTMQELSKLPGSVLIDQD